MRATTRVLLALVLVATAVVGASSTSGAQEADYTWTFDPPAVASDPDPAPTSFVRANAGPIEACASFDASVTVTMDGVPVHSNLTVDAGGTLQATFTPYVPGTYVVEGTCTDGDQRARISGTMVVPQGSDPRHPTLSVTPLAVAPGQRVVVTATYCLISDPGVMFNLLVDGPHGRDVVSHATDATGSVSLEYTPPDAGTYTMTGTCSDADFFNIFVYPQSATVVAGDAMGAEDPRPMGPDDLLAAPVARGVTAAPGYTG